MPLPVGWVCLLSKRQGVAHVVELVRVDVLTTVGADGECCPLGGDGEEVKVHQTSRDALPNKYDKNVSIVTNKHNETTSPQLSVFLTVSGKDYLIWPSNPQAKAESRYFSWLMEVLRKKHSMRPNFLAMYHGIRFLSSLQPCRFRVYATHCTYSL